MKNKPSLTSSKVSQSVAGTEKKSSSKVGESRRASKQIDKVPQVSIEKVHNKTENASSKTETTPSKSLKISSQIEKNSTQNERNMRKEERTQSSQQRTPSSTQRTPSDAEITPSKLERTSSKIQKTTSQDERNQSKYEHIPSQQLRTQSQTKKIPNQQEITTWQEEKAPSQTELETPSQSQKSMIQEQSAQSQKGRLQKNEAYFTPNKSDRVPSQAQRTSRERQPSIIDRAPIIAEITPNRAECSGNQVSTDTTLEKYELMMDDSTLDIQLGALDSGIEKLHWVIEQTKDTSYGVSFKIEAAKVLNSQALSILNKQEAKDANKLLQAAIQITSQPNFDAVTHALTLCNLGVCMRRQGKLSSSLEVLIQSLNTILPTKNETYLGNIYLNLAIIHSQIGLHDRAVSYAKKALKLCESDDETDQPFKNVNLGVSIAEKESKVASSILCHRTLGLEEEALGNRNVAAQHFSRALDIAEQIFGESHPMTLTSIDDQRRFIERSKKSEFSPISYSSFREEVSQKVWKSKTNQKNMEKKKKIFSDKINFQFAEAEKKEGVASEQDQLNGNKDAEEINNLQKLYNEACNHIVDLELKLQSKRLTDRSNNEIQIIPEELQAPRFDANQQDHRTPSQPMKETTKERVESVIIGVLEDQTISKFIFPDQQIKQLSGRVFVSFDEEQEEVAMWFQSDIDDFLAPNPDDPIHRIDVSQLSKNKKFTDVNKRNALVMEIVEDMMPILAIDMQLNCLIIIIQEQEQNWFARRASIAKTPIKLTLKNFNEKFFLLPKNNSQSFLFLDDPVQLEDITSQQLFSPSKNNYKKDVNEQSIPQSPDRMDFPSDLSTKFNISNQEKQPSLDKRDSSEEGLEQQQIVNQKQQPTPDNSRQRSPAIPNQRSNNPHYQEQQKSPSQSVGSRSSLQTQIRASQNQQSPQLIRSSSKQDTPVSQNSKNQQSPQSKQNEQQQPSLIYPHLADDHTQSNEKFDDEEPNREYDEDNQNYNEHPNEVLLQNYPQKDYSINNESHIRSPANPNQSQTTQQQGTPIQQRSPANPNQSSQQSPQQESKNPSQRSPINLSYQNTPQKKGVKEYQKNDLSYDPVYSQGEAPHSQQLSPSQNSLRNSKRQDSNINEDIPSNTNSGQNINSSQRDSLLPPIYSSSVDPTCKLEQDSEQQQYSPSKQSKQSNPSNKNPQIQETNPITNSQVGTPSDNRESQRQDPPINNVIQDSSHTQQGKTPLQQSPAPSNPSSEIHRSQEYLHPQYVQPENDSRQTPSPSLRVMPQRNAESLESPRIPSKPAQASQDNYPRQAHPEAINYPNRNNQHEPFLYVPKSIFQSPNSFHTDSKQPGGHRTQQVHQTNSPVNQLHQSPPIWPAQFPQPRGDQISRFPSNNLTTPQQSHISDSMRGIMQQTLYNQDTISLNDSIHPQKLPTSQEMRHFQQPRQQERQQTNQSQRNMKGKEDLKEGQGEIPPNNQIQMNQINSYVTPGDFAHQPYAPIASSQAQSSPKRIPSKPAKSPSMSSQQSATETKSRFPLPHLSLNQSSELDSSISQEGVPNQIHYSKKKCVMQEKVEPEKALKPIWETIVDSKENGFLTFQDIDPNFDFLQEVICKTCCAEQPANL